MFLLWWILVGLIAGLLAGKIMRGNSYGILPDILVGIVGAVGGGFIMRILGFVGKGGFLYTIFVAVLGAMLVIWLIRRTIGNRRR